MAQSIDNFFTPHQLQQIETTFKIFDTDKDQKLNRHEAKTALDKIGSKLQYEEFITIIMMCECIEQEFIEFPIFKLMALKKQELQLNGQEIENGGGLNSREEIEEIMKELGAKKTAEEFDQMFRSAKLNEDNEITLSEYVRILNINNN